MGFVSSQTSSAFSPPGGAPAGFLLVTGLCPWWGRSPGCWSGSWPGARGAQEQHVAVEDLPGCAGKEQLRGKMGAAVGMKLVIL